MASEVHENDAPHSHVERGIDIEDNTLARRCRPQPENFHSVSVRLNIGRYSQFLLWRPFLETSDPVSWRRALSG